MASHFTLRIWAILLIAAGYGWAGGHFIPGDGPLVAYLFQFVVLLLLVVFANGFLRVAAGQPGSSQARGRRNIIALSVFATLTLLINVANIIRGAMQTGPFGSHNRFADLVPIGLIILGDLLWLTSLIRLGGRAGKGVTPAGSRYEES